MISDLFLVVGAMGTYMAAMVFTIIMIVIKMLSYITNRRNRLLLRYYDVALAHGLIDRETGKVVGQAHEE